MPPRHRLRSHGKLSDTTFAQIVYFFCNGVPVKQAGEWTKVTPKTVRSIYLELRTELLRPEFNRWHPTNGRPVDIAEPGHEAIIRAGFFYVNSLCANNETCARNWRLGNRKSRQCRNCPLSTVYDDDGRRKVYEVVDALHDFYERLGIRGDTKGNSITIFQERLVHMTVVLSVLANSRRLESGLTDLKERGELCAGELFRRLVAVFWNQE